MSICTKCRVAAKAFIRKPGNAGPASRLAAASCLLCGALIGPAATIGTQAAPTDAYNMVRLAGPALHSPVPGQAESGDSEPPHNEGPDLTRDGSAATYSATAPTAAALAPPSRAPLPMPGHALLPTYPPGPVRLPPVRRPAAPGPHAAPTHLVKPQQSPGPYRPPAGPGLARS